MIVVLTYKREPDQALTEHMNVLAKINGEEVRFCTSFAEAEAIVCNGRVSGRQDRPAQEPVTRVVVHNYPAPAGSREPSLLAAVRRFNDCWGMRGGNRVLKAELFPDLQFSRENRDSDSPFRLRERHTAIRLT